MASDLSILIEEAISSTLETNISKSTSIINTFVASKDAIKELNIISIYATFAFNDITIGMKFIFPAYISSLIFNTMMMEEAEPSLEVDDDIADAIKEVLSQVCGSLELAINGSAFEDLGSTKFSIGDYEILKGEDYNIINTLILLNLKVEETVSEIFIDFEELALEYLDKFKNSESIAEEVDEDNNKEDDEITEENAENEKDNEITEENKENEKDDENIEKNEDNKKEEKTTEDNNKEEEKNISKEEEDQNIDESNDEQEEEKKNKKLKLLIMIVGGILATVIIAFGVSFFMGVFDKPEPIVSKDINKTIVPKQNIIIIDVKNKQIDFKMEMINKKRLNRRLAFLTKYDILEEDALERFKQKEKERLYKLKMNRLEEFANNNKEESLFKKNINGKTSSKKDRFNQDKNTTISVKNQEILDNEKLTFIQISSLKYKKYKDIINKEKTKNIQISICKNSQDKVDVFIGPIYLKIIINNIINKIKNNTDAKIVILKRKEFDKRCDF